jgi:hypothetical protein
MGKPLEGNSNIRAFAWKESGKPVKTSIRIADLRAEIQIQHLRK